MPKIFVTPIVGKRLEVAHTTNRQLRRADVKHWPSRFGSMSAKRLAPPSCRTGLAIRNERGRLEWFSFAEIRHAGAMARAQINAAA